MSLACAAPNARRASFRPELPRVGVALPSGSVRRAGPVVDLRRPPIAVWAGEVVLVAAPDARELEALLAAARVRGPDRLRVAEPARAYAAAVGAEALAASAARGAAVLAGVHAEADSRTRRVLATVRAGVGRRVPCRCVWLYEGRVYPE